MAASPLNVIQTSMEEITMDGFFVIHHRVQLMMLALCATLSVGSTALAAVSVATGDGGAATKAAIASLGFVGLTVVWLELSRWTRRKGRLDA